MIGLIFILLFNSSQIDARLDNKFTRRKLTIGDPFEITLEVNTNQGTKLNGPMIDSIEPFTIVNVDRKTISEKGKNKDIFKLRLIPFQTGDLSVPSFNFLNIKGEQTDTLKSPSIPLIVHSVLPADMKDINDLKPAVEYPNYLPLIIFLIAIFIAALAYTVFRLYKKYRMIRETPRPLPLPWIEAQIALENIPLADWLKKRWIKKYYYTLSEILKRYLERRFLFNAQEQTTTEIMYHLKLQKAPLREDFTSFFNRADLVKYAKFVPPNEELASAIDRARALVQKTIPAEISATRDKK